MNHKNAPHSKVSSEDFEILSVLGTGGERLAKLIVCVLIEGVCPVIIVFFCYMSLFQLNFTDDIVKVNYFAV